MGPLPAVVSVSLDPASDSGRPNHPGYTHVTTPTFEFQVNQMEPGLGRLTQDVNLRRRGAGEFAAAFLAPAGGDHGHRRIVFEELLELRQRG